MSFLAKMVRKKSKDSSASSTSSSASDAIQKLVNLTELLTKKQSFLESKLEEEMKLIKKHGKSDNKKEALSALKRKKAIERKLSQIDSTLTTLEFQKDALENAHTNSEVVKVMDVAAKSLKDIQKNMNVDKVEDMLDSIKDSSVMSEDISTAISSAIKSEFDEDDLLKELESLEQEDELERELNQLTAKERKAEDKMTEDEEEKDDLKLPDVPTDKLPVQKSKSKKREEEDELRQLAEWAD